MKPLFAALSSLLSFSLLASALEPLSKIDSANGFERAFKGWTSFPLQAFNRTDLGYGTAFLTFDHLMAQARAMKDSGLVAAGYTILMIDSGVFQDGGDANGRFVPNEALFPNGFPSFVQQLRSMGLSVGIYIVPGVFSSDISANPPKFISNGGGKTMADINVPCSKFDTEHFFPCSFGRQDLNYTANGAASQAWVDSVVQQFADW